MGHRSTTGWRDKAVEAGVEGTREGDYTPQRLHARGESSTLGHATATAGAPYLEAYRGSWGAIAPPIQH